MIDGNTGKISTPFDSEVFNLFNGSRRTVNYVVLRFGRRTKVSRTGICALYYVVYRILTLLTFLFSCILFDLLYISVGVVLVTVPYPLPFFPLPFPSIY